MNTLEKFIKIMQTEMNKPTLYGGAHLFFLALAISAIIIVCLKCRKLSDRNLRKILLIIGSTLIVLEILKQLNFAYDATTDSWEYEWKQAFLPSDPQSARQTPRAPGSSHVRR